MEGDAVRAGGVVVYQAEVEGAACCCLGGETEGVETFWDGAGLVPGVGGLVVGFGVDGDACGGEEGGCV